MTQTKPYKIELHSNKDIRVWWTPEPKRLGTPSLRKFIYTESLFDYEVRLSSWQSSYVTLECAEGEYEKITKYAVETCHPSFDITSFAEVMEVIKFCKGQRFNGCINHIKNNKCDKDCEIERLIFFRAPESVEGETQEDHESQIDLAKTIQDMFERGDDWAEVLELFTIKRK